MDIYQKKCGLWPRVKRFLGVKPPLKNYTVSYYLGEGWHNYRQGKMVIQARSYEEAGEAAKRMKPGAFQYGIS